MTFYLGSKISKARIYTYAGMGGGGGCGRMNRLSYEVEIITIWYAFRKYTKNIKLISFHGGME